MSHMVKSVIKKCAPTLLTLMIMLLVAGCSSSLRGTATPDYGALAAEVQQALSATLTAQAPVPTMPAPVALDETPVPSETTTVVATLAQPTLAADEQIAYVRIGEEQAANIILTDYDRSVEQQLTHFVEELNMSDLSWSADGEWLVFVSAHDYIRSHDLERNIFIMRADGSELQMVTGDSIAAGQAAGPFVTISGTVAEVGAGCLVMAQGATSAALTDESGAFELTGVPVGATWIRAVYPTEGGSRQGTVDLVLSTDSNSPITITLADAGQGWTQASISPDGTRIAGSLYSWSLVDGQRAVETQGLVIDLETGEETMLDYGTESTITSLIWSSDGQSLVGTLYDESGVSIVQWDTTLASAQELVRLDNPEDTIYSAFDPVWSTDGARLAFSLRSWYWWGENRYKSDIVILDVATALTTTVVESEWGVDARKPAWSVDDSTIYYQTNEASASTEASVGQTGVWRITLDGRAPEHWLDGAEGYLPSVRPVVLSPSEE